VVGTAAGQLVGAVVSLLLMVQLVGLAGPEKGVSLAVGMPELALVRPLELAESASGGLLSGVMVPACDGATYAVSSVSSINRGQLARVADTGKTGLTQGVAEKV
jgi:hypothetical protein